MASTPTSLFKSTCSIDTGSAKAESSLQPGNMVMIGTSTDLSTCIRDSNEAKVYSITLLQNAGPFDYKLSVIAEGPSGVFSGGLQLAFTDGRGEVYKLYIYSSRKQEHTLSYNSDQPNITLIEWSS